MNIYKLRFATKAAAEKDLKAKGVYVVTEEGLTYGIGIHAVVEIGKIITTDGIYDLEVGTNIITLTGRNTNTDAAIATIDQCWY